MRYTGPKVKKARRLGMAFTAKDAKILQKRSYAPGQHGQKGRRKISEYAVQLREKQKVKRMYGLFERQFQRCYLTASKKKAEVKEFVEFYLNHGPHLITQVKYVPLPAKVYALNLEHFKNGKMGTVFGGEAQVGIKIEEVVKRGAKP